MTNKAGNSPPKASSTKVDPINPAPPVTRIFKVSPRSIKGEILITL
jgi:hypothetical protein